jgi:predicted DNA-binding transcriptional regulator AlpA
MAKATTDPEAAKPIIAALALRKRSAAKLLDISERTIERLLAAGKFPRPDAHAGRCPLWTPRSLIQWIAEGGGQR